MHKSARFADSWSPIPTPGTGCGHVPLVPCERRRSRVRRARYASMQEHRDSCSGGRARSSRGVLMSRRASCGMMILLPAIASWSKLRTGSRNVSAIASRSKGSRSRSAAARSLASSDRTAPARRPRCGRWARSWPRPRVRRRSPASPSRRRTALRFGGGSRSCRRRPASISVSAELFAQPGVAPALIHGPDILAQLIFTPLIAGWSIWIAIAISARSSDIRAAQQLSMLA